MLTVSWTNHLRVSARLLVPALAVVLVGSACTAKVDTVSIEPKRISFDTESQSRMLVVTALNKDGEPIENKAALFSSSDPAVAAVDATSGKVTPQGSGKARITAIIEEAQATVDVEVTLIKALKLDSVALVTKVGEPTPALKATFMNERGEPTEGGDRKVEWATADPTIATVADGVITPVTAGSTTLSASFQGLRADLALTVTPADPPPGTDAGPEVEGP